MGRTIEKEYPTNDSTTKDPFTRTTTNPSTSSSAATMSLMANALERAENTLSRSFQRPTTRGEEEEDPSLTHASHLPEDTRTSTRPQASAATDAFAPIDTARIDSSTTSTGISTESTTTATATRFPPPTGWHDDNNEVALGYGQNPTITSTALAHMLWSYVLRPGIDSAIDATAGNGSDTLVLAKLLFASNDRDSSTPCTSTDSTTTRNMPKKKENQSQLLAVDVQETACQKTRQRLAKFLVSDQHNHVQVVCASHAPLPLPPDTSNIALVVYNLGYLPNNNNNNNNKSPTTSPTVTRVKTQTETTLASLADAALALRVGGMLSVMTYPRSNATEDAVVRAFLEGLALFSSQTQSYMEYVQSLDDGVVKDSLRERLRVTLQHVREEGGRQQTWRVHEHKKLGWVDAPILLTATRIK
jgi:hypothetical protein